MGVRIRRLVVAVLGFLAATLGVGLLVGAVFGVEPMRSRFLLGLGGACLLGVSYLLYRSQATFVADGSSATGRQRERRKPEGLT